MAAFCQHTRYNGRQTKKMLIKSLDLKLQRALYQDIICSNEMLREAEELIAKNPKDCETRARLLLYYTIKGHKLPELERKAKRVEHICWFIKNMPDSVFGGQTNMHLTATQHHYQRIKQLWQDQVKARSELTTRLNAYMFLADSSDPETAHYFAQWFANDKDNIWVRALSDHSQGQSQWLDSVVEDDRDKDWPKQAQINRLSKAASQAHIEQLPVDYYENPDLSMLHTCLAKTSWNLNDLILIACNTWFGYEYGNMLGFDPEILEARLKIIIWLIKHAPASPLFRHPFFNTPFVGHAHVFWLEQPQLAAKPIRYLATLLTRQLQTQTASKELIKNVHYFKAEVGGPALSGAEGKALNTALKEAKMKLKSEQQ